MTNVRIGFAAPLTGPQALVGVPMSNAARLGVAHGALELEGLGVDLVAVDDEADPAVAAKIAAELAADPLVLGVVGHKNSGPCAAAGPVYADAGLAFVSPCATDDRLAGGTFQRMCATNDAQARAAAAHAVRDLGARRLATVHDSTEYGEPLVGAFVAEARRLGAEVVASLALRVGQPDCSAEADTLISAQPRLVYAGMTEVEGALLVRALREAGSPVPFLAAAGGPTSAFVELAADAAEGTIHTYAGADPGATAAGRAFLDEFARFYGTCPNYGPEAHDAALAMLRAIGGGARSRAELLHGLRHGELGAGATGKIRFDSRGERLGAGVSMWTVRRGRMQAVVGPG